MVLMFIADWISDTGFARRSLLLWILLAAAVGLTYWECRERLGRPSSCGGVLPPSPMSRSILASWWRPPRDATSPAREP